MALPKCRFAASPHTALCCATQSHCKSTYGLLPECGLIAGQCVLSHWVSMSSSTEHIPGRLGSTQSFLRSAAACPSQCGSNDTSMGCHRSPLCTFVSCSAASAHYSGQLSTACVWSIDWSEPGAAHTIAQICCLSLFSAMFLQSAFPAAYTTTLTSGTKIHLTDLA